MAVGFAAVAPVISGAFNCADGIAEAARRRGLLRRSESMAKSALQVHAILAEKLNNIRTPLGLVDPQGAEPRIAQATQALKAHAQWFGVQNIHEFVAANSCTAYTLEREMVSFLVQPVRTFVDEVRAAYPSQPETLTFALKNLEQDLVALAYEHFSVCIAREHERSHLKRNLARGAMRWIAFPALLGASFMACLIVLDHLSTPQWQRDLQEARASLATEYRGALETQRKRHVQEQIAPSKDPDAMFRRQIKEREALKAEYQARKKQLEGP